MEPIIQGNKFLDAWNQCEKISENKLQEKFKENNELFKMAMVYMKNNVDSVLKDSTITVKVLNCIPDEYAQYQEINKLLSVLNEINIFKTEEGDLVNFSSKLQNTLKTYIEEEKIELSLNFLNHGVPVTEEMMWIACDIGSQPIIEKLLERGLSIDARDKEGNTPLMMALKARSLDSVSFLVKQGADINAVNGRGITALLMAIQDEDSIEFVKVLVKGGANTNLPDGKGNPPLDWALYDDSFEVAAILIEQGACISLENYSEDSAIINRLLSFMQKAHFFEKDRSSSNNMVHALQNHLETYIVEKRTDMALKFLDSGVPPTEKMLFAACEKGDKAIVSKILEKGVNINAPDEGGNTPLVIALKSNSSHSIDLAMQLIKRGADIHVANKQGETALLWAIGRGSTDLAKELIERGAEVNKADHEGNTPLITALESDSPDLAMQLIEKGADIHRANKKGETALHLAIRRGLTDLAKELIERGAEVNGADHEGNTPLIAALESDSPDLAMELIEKGADIHRANKKGETALLWAIGRGLTDLAKELIERGVDVNLADLDGQTPLLNACEAGLLEVVEILIDKAAEINKADSKGNTPLIYACDRGYVDIALLLIKKGADVNKTNNEGHNALKFAFSRELFDVALELVKKEGVIWGSTIISLDLLTNPDAEEVLQYCCKGFNFIDFMHALPNFNELTSNELEISMKNWLQTNPAVPDGETLFKIPFLFGQEIDALETYKQMTKEEQKINISLLNQHFGENEIEQRVYNMVWTVDKSHYKAGKEIAEKVPTPLPVEGLDLLLNDLNLLETEEARKDIQEMLEKIKQQTKIMGLGDKSLNEMKEWYDVFSSYLLHVIKDYKIGQPGGDLEVKKQILQRLADMQVNCAPRWKDEIKQMYAVRPQAESLEEEEYSELNLGDYLLQKLRNERIHIVTTKLLELGIVGNVHEPNYLLDLLGEDLGFRLDKINDPFNDYGEIHPQGRPLERFEAYYTPFRLKSDLINHLREQQIREKTSSDSLDLSPLAVYDWLKENVMIHWKEDEYQQLPSKVKEMEAAGKSSDEINAFLNQYGISSYDPASRIAEGERALQSRLDGARSALDSAQKNSDRYPNSNALKRLVTTKEAEKNRLEGFQKKLEISSQEEKLNILEEIKCIQTNEEVFKEARENHFFKTEIYDEKGLFTPLAAEYLLESVKAITRR